MKNFLFILLCMAILTGSEYAWASEFPGEAIPIGQDPGLLPVIASFVIFALLVICCGVCGGGGGKGTPAEEAEIYKRIQNNRLKEYQGEQYFEFEIYKKQRFELLSALVLMVVAIAVYGWLCPSDHISRVLFGAVLLLFLGIMAVGLSMTVRTPFSIRVTPETIFVKRWWPCSSPVIHLVEIERIELSWARMGNTGYNISYYSLLYSEWLAALLAVVFLAEMYSGPKMVEKIHFIMNDEKKYSLKVTSFSAAMIEKLVRFLKHAGLENKIVFSREKPVSDEKFL